MSDTNTKVNHWPSNAVLIILLVLACASVAIDIWDGYWPKTVSSGLIVLGIVALMYARRYHSSRWRVIMMIAFTLAAVAMLGRLALWQGWV